MLAWRGRGRDELLTALRAIQAGPGRSRVQAGREAGPEAGSAPGTAGRAGLDVAARPLAESLDAFWSPGLSPARLRATVTAPPTAPDLLLRSFEPPPVLIRGQDLPTLLAPAYEQLAAGDEAPA
jgi:hypothetical protein